MKRVILAVAFLFFVVGNSSADSNVFPLDGNVGIGTDTPGAKLDIGGAPYTDCDFFQVTAASRASFFKLSQTDNHSINLDYTRSDGENVLKINGHTRNVIFGGNVGIGTISPASKLDVNGSVHVGGKTSPNQQLTIKGANPGVNLIAHINESASLRLFNSNRTSGNYNDISFFNGNNLMDSRIVGIHKNHGLRQGELAFFTYNTSGMTEKMRITSDGNIGIGTAAPGHYKLAVEGAVGAREVVVTQADWADYVFRDDYDLKPLDEVETFIKDKKHLPDVPSVEEVKANGLNMSEMMATQMKKIEELTLHLIEQNKKVSRLVKENAEIRKELARMKGENRS